MIREILDRQQRFFVLIIDGVDELQRDELLDWLPQQLGSAKMILTISELADEGRTWMGRRLGTPLIC